MNNLVHFVLEFTVGNLFGKDITCREPVDRCDDYQPGTLVEIGRTGVKVGLLAGKLENTLFLFVISCGESILSHIENCESIISITTMLGVKKFLMPCGLCAAVPAIKPADPAQDCPVACDNKTEPKVLVRPSELPIYTIEDDCSKHMAWQESNYTPSALEETFGQVRRSVQGMMMEYHNLTESFTSKIDTGREHSQFMLEYLREESNLLPRVGAISVGGITGLILGLRGGKFKRFIYTSTGVLMSAAVCYPKQAAESLEVAQRYANIGYNFVYGVKPGDEQLTIALPEMPKFKVPTSLSEFLELTVDTGSAVIGAVASVADKARQTVSQTKEASTTSKSPSSSSST